MPIPIGSGVYVKLDSVKDSLTSAALASGTCTYALKDSLGTTISTGSMPYQSTTSAGANYLGTIAASITSSLSPNIGYAIVITFAQTAGAYGYVVTLYEPAVNPQG